MPITKKEGIARLAAVPMFEGLSKRDLGRLWNQLAFVHHDEGNTIVTEGRTGAGFHLILSGEAKVVRRGKHLVLGPGDFFGEIAVIDDAPRTASIVATSPMETAVLSRWELRAFIDSNPKLAWRFMEYLTRRLREEQSLVDAATS